MTQPIKPATSATCESCLRDVTRHMDAYYYGFSATGVREVDDPRRGSRIAMNALQQMGKARSAMRRVDPKLPPATFDGMYGYKDRNND